jgi:virginiamycin B lyase
VLGRPRCYADYVDERDIVWIAEWSSNALFSFDPVRERFDRRDLARPDAGIRQILGREGEVWLPESGTEHITLIRTG